MRKIKPLIVAVFSTIFSATVLTEVQATSPFSKGRLSENQWNQGSEIDTNYSIPPDTLLPEIVPVFSPSDYKLRLEKISAQINLDYNSHVQSYINVYAFKRRPLVEQMLTMSEYYFPLFEKIFEENGVPKELKYLSLVESALNPFAKSRVGATGLWQFMRTTGKLYGLKINDYIDERQDPEKATRAAAQYFKEMYRKYGDWLLVIAAYNCGPGHVSRAINRSGSRDFWTLRKYLPVETRGYVPAYIAATYIMNYSKEHNFSPLDTSLEFTIDSISIDKPLKFEQIANETGISVEELKFYNPIFKRQIIPSFNGEKYGFCVPASRKEAFAFIQDSTYNFDLAQQEQFAPEYTSYGRHHSAKNESTSSLLFHKVRKGDNLGAISRKYHVSIADLKKWNRISGNRLKVGQRLKVKDLTTKNPTTAKTKKIKEKASKTLRADNGNQLIKSKVKYHRVNSGDTLWSIAQRYEGVTVDMLKKVNHLKDSKSLKVGMMLRVPLG